MEINSNDDECNIDENRVEKLRGLAEGDSILDSLLYEKLCFVGR